MQQRVLDATIECIVERGYASTSTRHIAARAGVTVGAVQHHYDTKAELMAAALQELGERLADQVLVAAPAESDVQVRAAGLLDRLWAMHNGPLYEAGIELAVAARTDRELAAAMETVAEAFTLRVGAAMLEMFPELVAQPGFTERLLVGLATLRGLALPPAIGGMTPAELWPVARAQLLELFDTTAVKR